MLPATADVADCPEVRGIWDKYDAWCDSMNVPRANHGIVTVYSDGSMNIDYHYDKKKTIAEDSLITIVKTGEVGRPFQIRQRLYAPWASEVPEAQREGTPMATMDATKQAALSVEQKAKYKADQQRRSAFTKEHNAVKPFFDMVVPVGDALIMTIPANLATEHAVPTVEEAAESGSIVLRTTTEVVEYQQALREAGGSADPVSAGGGALSTASSAAVKPAAAAAASTAAAAASTAASHVTIAEHNALKLKYNAVVAQLLKKTAENRSLLDQNERLLFAAADKCSICQDTIQQRATVNCDAKHAFCKGCIHLWLTKMSSACPNCKCEVTELRCPPDAEKSEAIEPRQQRHPDDVTPLDPAAAVEHEVDFLADQRDLRRTFNVDGDGGGEEAPGWAGYVEQGSAPERREERSQQRRVAAAAGERQPRAGEVAEAEGEQSHEMEVEEQEDSALWPRGSLPLPNFQQLEWRLDGVPEDVIVASDGVTQQLYDTAVAEGTLLVRTEDEAKEWEARRSPPPSCRLFEPLRMHALTLATTHA